MAVTFFESLRAYGRDRGTASQVKTTFGRLFSSRHDGAGCGVCGATLTSRIERHDGRCDDCWQEMQI